MRRVGVMGGMFDPVHSGHIAVALEAVTALSLDELRMVPCHIPSHRGPATATVQDRVAMLKLAIKNDERLLVDERECASSGVSYTVDTLTSLRREFPDVALVLVMGADAFGGLAAWHQWRQIPQLAHIAVVSRPGAKVEISADAVDELRGRQVDSAQQMFVEREGRLILLSHLQLDVSSTQVRSMLQSQQTCCTQTTSGQTISGQISADLLPDAVAAYIDKHDLYRAE